jgi:predicted DNA-binding transcriptional regulator AlpA
VIQKTKGSNPPLFENFITLEELLAYLKGRFAKGTIYNWVHGKRFPNHRMRGRLYFVVDEVDQWFRTN